MRAIEANQSNPILVAGSLYYARALVTVGILFFTFSVLLGGCGDGFRHPATYQVYSDSLRGINVIESKTFVIISDTAQFTREGNYYSEKGLDSILPDTVEDFVTKNKKVGVVLTDNFAKDLSVHLISEQELKTIFANNTNDDWKEFYRQFPESTGFIHLSQVGFSKDGTQALFFGSSASGPTSGGGFLNLLTWNGKSWETLESVRLWIS